MSPRDEESNTKILIQIAGDIGRTREATETLKDNYATLTEDVKEIKEQLGKTVTAPECVEKHRQVSKTMEIVKGEIIAEIHKNNTGPSHPAVTQAMIKAATAPTVQEMATALEEKEEEKKEKRRKLLITWLSIVTALSGLVVTGAYGVYRVAIFASKLETMVTTGTQEVQSELRKNKTTKTVILKFPGLPADGDSFTEPDSPAPLDPTVPVSPKKKIPAKKGK